MQQSRDILGYVRIDPTAPVTVGAHGGRAKCLQRLIRLDFPVPVTVAYSFDAVRDIARGQRPDVRGVLAAFGEDPLMSVRPSSEVADWGGPGAVLNIGMNQRLCAKLGDQIGAEAADTLYLRFVQTFAVQVQRLDPEMFEFSKSATVAANLDAALRAYQDETDEPFPQDPAEQLAEVLRSMARAWEGTTARLLRQARGAPADAGLGLIVQAMALGLGPAESGAGVVQYVNSDTGERQITGRYMSQSQGRAALTSQDNTAYLTRDKRGPSLQDLCPDIFTDLVRLGGLLREKLREEMQMEFTIQEGKLQVLDAVRIARSARAQLKIAVDLANDNIISRDEALIRVAPRSLPEILHPQVDTRANRNVFARGIAASPGGAVGRIVFTSADAQSSHARGEPCILVRRETVPEDIRGMHSAVGVLTERGGQTSHAAVIARGLGLPCVVGVTGLRISSRDKVLKTADGRSFSEGDLITLDGTRGEAMVGAVNLVDAALGNSFQELMSWADARRDIGVRANADTPADAAVAKRFAAQGIGLCRTEHMFFEHDRLTVMREMIFADDAKDRQEALARLLPMQRGDFKELFMIMAGLPVCIRLFDPPLHEFLPSDREGMKDLAEALSLPLSDVTRRIQALSEFNPMLGMRGVRLGITVPEIYDMQARAIFEAAVEAGEMGDPIVPEIMIPLVSAMREVELVKARIDAVASAVKIERHTDFTYRLGVMVETPRAALRAGDIAQHASFLSFGTNDLTQMTYGLSRDDAGRFMSDYVAQGVFPEDPFHMLDQDGVGELLKIGAARGRAARSDMTLSICGEHGGDPESIAFCRAAGVDYVSCSPFRVPVARLAAAQLVVNEAAAQSPADA